MASETGVIAVPGQTTAAAAEGKLLALPIAWWSAGVRLAAICLQLALVTLAIQAWQIDNRAFRWHFLLVCVGFVINHLLPLRLRLPFFAVLSLGALVSLLGLAQAAYLVGTGLVLIAIAHLPIAFAARVVLMAVAGGALMYLRQSSTLPAMAGLWPILGSMFMFRMIIYLYDLKTRSAPFGPWRSLAYFFMFPNVFFPLYPIVDYKTFNRTFYNREAFSIYQKGMDWIVRGIIQLLLYRLIYQNLMLDPQAVSNLGELARFLATNFLLYLRISGNFHLIVGILHLFGFNLSETHHKYLLSNSFTDFWRRINIYWKDFIQKIFFYPVYFRVKKRGELYGIAVATCLAFFATWALHSYQWFWLRGRFLVTWQDITFWAILAAGVLVNVLYEAKTTRARQARKVSRTWQGELSRALRTIAMFVFICLLWSLWNAASLEEWLTMLSKARYASAADVAWIVAALAALGVAAVLWGASTSERTDAAVKVNEAAARREFWQSAAITGGLALALVLVDLNIRRFAPNPTIENLLEELATNKLNAQDLERLERGYYEALLDEQRFNPELGELYMSRPANWNQGALNRQRTDGRFPTSEFIPSQSIKLASGGQWTTNSHSMRDQEYTLEKPPGTYRIALLGDSNSAGLHVDDKELFEYLVEKRLNEAAGNPQPPAYQILNFSCSSYGLYARLNILPKALAFHPDAVLCVSVNDWHWAVRDVGKCVSDRLKIPDKFVQDIVKQAGLEPGMNVNVCEHRLEPYRAELAAWCYQRLGEECRKRGIRPLAAFLPRLEDRIWEQRQLPALKRAAQDAGFTVIDLTTAYDTVEERRELWAWRWDSHPNARGHQLLADLLYQKLQDLNLRASPEPPQGRP